ncbi:Ubiquitin-like-specific protease 1A [Dendrobium catenatum]|uniref:Ubiquitin-like-specific protease 1A n=1 Tax=Dendrobium catenatum TaxID=906689 RepID=A0A2I0V7K0_9ASPA|nr:Ubiquitin-like-specific protease 1A [Dendrobium catenatum]
MSANLIIVPIINEKYWTLLVGNLSKKRWEFFDSLPKATHKAIFSDVISHLYVDSKNAWHDDIRNWPIETIKNVSTQNNNVDCGMFICKYMEAVIQLEPVQWELLKDWQSSIALFRAELAYGILCTNIQ